MTVVVSDISSSLMLDGDSVSKSLDVISGGMPRSIEFWTVISSTVAQILLRISATKTGNFGKCFGSRWKPMENAIRIRLPDGIQLKSTPTAVICRARRRRQWIWSMEMFSSFFSNKPEVQVWAANTHSRALLRISSAPSP